MLKAQNITIKDLSTDNFVPLKENLANSREFLKTFAEYGITSTTIKTLPIGLTDDNCLIVPIVGLKGYLLGALVYVSLEDPFFILSDSKNGYCGIPDSDSITVCRNLIELLLAYQAGVPNPVFFPFADLPDSITHHKDIGFVESVNKNILNRNFDADYFIYSHFYKNLKNQEELHYEKIERSNFGNTEVKTKLFMLEGHRAAYVKINSERGIINQEGEFFPVQGRTEKAKIPYVYQNQRYIYIKTYPFAMTVMDTTPTGKEVFNTLFRNVVSSINTIDQRSAEILSLYIMYMYLSPYQGYTFPLHIIYDTPLIGNHLYRCILPLMYNKDSYTQEPGLFIGQHKYKALSKGSSVITEDVMFFDRILGFPLFLSNSTYKRHPQLRSHSRFVSGKILESNYEMKNMLINWTLFGDAPTEPIDGNSMVSDFDIIKGFAYALKPMRAKGSDANKMFIDIQRRMFDNITNIKALRKKGDFESQGYEFFQAQVECNYNEEDHKGLAVQNSFLCKSHMNKFLKNKLTE